MTRKPDLLAPGLIRQVGGSSTGSIRGSAAQSQGETVDRIALAAQLYREFHASCFWHCPKDLVITEDKVEFVAKGLRAYGGHRGFRLAGKLTETR